MIKISNLDENGRVFLATRAINKSETCFFTGEDLINGQLTLATGCLIWPSGMYSMYGATQCAGNAFFAQYKTITYRY